MSIRTTSDLKSAYRGVQVVPKYYVNFPEVPQITCWEHITDRGLKIEHEMGESGGKKWDFYHNNVPMQWLHMACNTNQGLLTWKG